MSEEKARLEKLKAQFERAKATQDVEIQKQREAFVTGVDAWRTIHQRTVLPVLRDALKELKGVGFTHASIDEGRSLVEGCNGSIRATNPETGQRVEVAIKGERHIQSDPNSRVLRIYNTERGENSGAAMGTEVDKTLLVEKVTSFFQ